MNMVFLRVNASCNLRGLNIFVTFVIVLFCSFSNSQELKKLDNLNDTFKIYINSNFKKAKATALLQLQESEKIDNKEFLLLSYLNLSEVYFRLKENGSAFMYSNKALDIALNKKDNKALSIIYNRLSFLEMKEEHYSKSLIYSEKSLKIAEANNLKAQISDVCFIRSLIYRKRIDYKKSFLDLRKSINISSENNFEIRLAKGYNLYANFIKGKKTDSAIYYFKEALKIAKRNNHKYLESYVSSNLGSALLNAKRYPETLLYLNKAKELCNQVSNYSTLHHVNMYLGYYYEEINDYEKAISSFEKAIHNYCDYIDDYQLASAYYSISGTYSHVKEYKKAFEYQDEYIYLIDDVLSIKKAKELDEIRTEYEVEKKNSQISLLEKENEIKATKQKWLIICAILLSLPLLVLFLFYRHRANTQHKIRAQEKEIYNKETQRLQKEQELVEVKALIEGQDKERHRIARELHDGVGGQLASVNMGLSHVNSSLKNSEITAIGNTLSKTFNELRVLSHSLSSNYHKERTLDSLIAELMHEYETSNTFNVEVSIFPENCLKYLEANIKHNLYRILQELLTNCAKYANASLVQISFNLHDTVLVMLYEDDGNGFDIEEEKKGVGLKNIEERIQTINGKINIESTPNIGTQIIIEIPLNVTLTE